jgi:hypothetical protein
LAPLIVSEFAQVIRLSRSKGVTILLIEQNMKLAEEVANDSHHGDKTWLRARSGCPRRTPGALHSGDIAANSVVTPRLPTSNRLWASLAMPLSHIGR